MSTTPHDRIAALLAGINTGKIGLYENIWPDTLLRWTAEGYPVDETGFPLPPEDIFGYDLGRLGGAFDPTPRLNYRVVLEAGEDWKIIENGAGVTEKVWLNKSAPAGHLSFQLDCPETWASEFRPLFEAFEPARIPVAQLQANWARHQAAGRWLCYNMSFIWENLRQTVGDICMYESLIVEPEWIADYNQVMLDFYIRHLEETFERVGVPDGMWFSEDVAYNQGLFCSPNTLQTLYLPFYRALTDYLHGKGMKVIFHSCGNITQALDLFVEMGFDALHPLHVHAGCDPLGIARSHGSKLVLLGGLDTHLLESGDHARIEDAQVRLMEGMRDAGARYIFCSDHSISTNVSYDTYLRMMDTYHKHAGL